MSDLAFAVLVGIAIGAPLGVVAWELVAEPFIVPWLAHRFRVRALHRDR